MSKFKRTKIELNFFKNTKNIFYHLKENEMSNQISLKNNKTKYTKETNQ